MAATVNIYELNGAAPGTPTSKTSGTVRFKNADDATVDLVDPLVIPAAGNIEHSFEKYLRLRIDDAGGFTQISDLQAYSDGQNNFDSGSPNEVLCYYRREGSYTAPAVPDQANDPPQGAGSPTENMTNLFTATSAAAIDMDGINAGPFTDGSPAEWIGDFLVLVMTVRPGATAGVTASETLTFAYSEI